MRVDADTRTGTAVGIARRRRQLRHRHRVRVRPASGRTDRARRADLLAARPGAAGAAVPARLRAGGTRRTRASRSWPTWRRPCRSCRRSATAHRFSGCCWSGRASIAAGTRVARAAAGRRHSARRDDPPGALPRPAVPARRQRAARQPRVLEVPPAARAVRRGDRHDRLRSPASITSPFSLLNGWVIGGAVSRVDPEATAVGAREVGFELTLVAVWPPGDARGRASPPGSGTAGRRCGRTAPASTPASCPTRDPPGCETAYGDRLDRLVALKDRYDPTNFFRLNANIPPQRHAPRRQPTNDSTTQGATR